MARLVTLLALATAAFGWADSVSLAQVPRLVPPRPVGSDLRSLPAAEFSGSSSPLAHPPALNPGSVLRLVVTDETEEDLPEHGQTARLWWQAGVADRMRPEVEANFVSVRRLVLAALQHSLHVEAIQQPVHVSVEEILEAEADFDIHAFVESKFIDLSEPVGNALLTGGPNRLNEHDWQFEAGIRKKTTHGGRLELSQRMGHKDSNSLFFIPPNQGNAQLTLNFTQPLLNGFGRAYNESLIVLADLDSQIAWDKYATELQDYLLVITDTYWQLYHQRALLLQKERHLERAQEILTELEFRVEIDALGSQIVRARAAVASRRSELARSAAAVRNVESRLRALINAPELTLVRSPELIPLELPLRDALPLRVSDAIRTALAHRPEVDEAMQRIRTACVRCDVSQNELLPSLSLVLETYVAGLEGNSSIGGALQRQLDR